MENKVTTPVTKGSIIALILVVFSLVLYFADLYMNKGISSLQYLIIIGGVIWSCISYANQMNNNVTFGNTFAHGFKTSAVITVLMIVYTVLSLKVLFPEMIDKILAETEKQISDKSVSDEQKDQALEMTKKFLVPFAMAGILFFYLVIGLIGSLIGAAVAKKNPQDPFGQPA